MIKSEIRISKLETISNVQNSNFVFRASYFDLNEGYVFCGGTRSDTEKGDLSLSADGSVAGQSEIFDKEGGCRC